MMMDLFTWLIESSLRRNKIKYQPKKLKRLNMRDINLSSSSSKIKKYKSRQNVQVGTKWLKYAASKSANSRLFSYVFRKIVSARPIMKNAPWYRSSRQCKKSNKSSSISIKLVWKSKLTRCLTRWLTISVPSETTSSPVSSNPSSTVK